jgi:hypothetical protein
MALPGGANHHDVIRSIPGSHSHTPQVILKPSRGDFSSHHTAGLRIDMLEVL